VRRKEAVDDGSSADRRSDGNGDVDIDVKESWSVANAAPEKVFSRARQARAEGQSAASFDLY
jgi:hypothetical protein